ncbi:small ribosomal subunit protein mS31 [Chanos chanos]|uniref:Small ribosomal subunit protein mS31 n=1 Tax=Chanos chanos TaxID=29144 RepID=A0A6J2WW40_CHACN|nr:28S ribosomal protein S31, mitochondrial [Chanos chanos]
MYRRVLLSVYQGRSALIHSKDTRFFSPRCNEILSFPILRTSAQSGQRSLGVSAASYCDRKEGPSSTLTEKVKKDGGRVEEMQMEAKKDDSAQVKMEAKTEGEVEGKSSEEQVTEGSRGSEAVVMTERVRDEGMCGEVEMEVNKDTRLEVEKEVNKDMRGEVEKEVNEDMRLEVEKEVNKDMRGEVEKEVNKDMRGEVENDREITTEAVTAARKEENRTDIKRESTQEGEGEALQRVEVKTEEEKVTEWKIQATESTLAVEAGHVEPRASVTKTESKGEGERVKSGKEGLLELLGAMKVEVTSKRKFKTPKIPRSSEYPPKTKPKPMESATSMFQQAASAESSPASETLSPDLVAAASAVASTLPNKSQVESELLRQLRKHEAVAEAQRKGEGQSIGTIIADMKVGRRPNGRPNARPANQIRFDDDGRGYTHERGIASELDGVRRRKSVFTGRRLNIFSVKTEQGGESELASPPSLWDIDLANQIVQSANQRPRNGFEEMIEWTREGKLWPYPVNNETGLEEEAGVPFHEHVFLERHLESGFPRQGPVRHFMELVVGGLSKNPHLTVQQKQEHIAWFREYFQQKEEILKEAEVYIS